MKKISAIILLLALLLCAGALADGTDGKGSHISRSGELAAFMDGNGNIFISGQSASINATPAESLISIDPYRILYFAKANEALSVPQGRLIALDLESHAESVVTDDAYAACFAKDSVYYVSLSDATKLYCLDIDSGKKQQLLDANERIERVYVSANGTVVSLVEGAGAYIQDAVSGAFVPYNGSLATELVSCEGYDVYLTDKRELYILDSGKTSPTLIDTNVQAWTTLREKVYYLCGDSQQLSLKCYDAANALWSIVLENRSGFEMQLTASEKRLFMLSSDNIVWTVENGKLVRFAELPTLESYKLTDKTLEGYLIEGVSGQLNIYGKARTGDLLPSFTFVDFSTQTVADESESLVLLSAYSISEEQTVWNLLQPAPQYSEKPLRRGSRGDAVAAIQQPLYDAGYYDYRIDGIFGWRTERAVKLLQMDLGLKITGSADADLQRIIIETKLADYDPYKQLARGDRGLRVQEMQERLRDLGFLADDADAIYGSRTQAAVERFQSEHGLDETGVADAKTLKKLYSSSAKPCESYIDLRKGDSGYRVRELNACLKELYYLEGDVGSSYNAATVEAVKRFQSEIGLKQSGSASDAMQQKLFSKKAPEYSGYITLSRGDTNERVKQMQKRLQKLNYYSDEIDGYFGANTQAAVKLFQRVCGLKATGTADPETLKQIFAADAPAYRVPEKITAPVIELSAYSKYENGIYAIADSVTSNGNVTASWFADGDVDAYDILITDDRDSVYLDRKGMSIDETLIAVPISSLDSQRTYTIRVTAHPKPYANDKSASASIRFIRLETEPEPEPEEIGKIGKLIVTPVGNDISRVNGVYQMSGETLEFAWSADGSVAGYVYELRDSGDGLLYSNLSVDATKQLQVNSGELSAEELYTLKVWAIPTNGTLEDATEGEISFRLKTPDPVQPTPEPTPASTPEPTPVQPTATPSEPVTIGRPQISIQPVERTIQDEVYGEILVVGDGDLQLSWSADGEIAFYNVCIYDENSAVKLNQDLQTTSGTFAAENMAGGMIYTVSVTAYAEADNSVSTTAALNILRPLVEDDLEPIVIESTPEPTEKPTEGPTPEPTEEPTPEPTEMPTPEPTEEPTPEPTEEPTPEPTEEPTPEPTEEPTPEPTEEPTPEPTEEPTPEPTEEPTPEPTEEPVVESSPYSTNDPSAWQTPIGFESDPAAITVIQNRLCEWKWLRPESYQAGVLDEATIAALLSFQNNSIDCGFSLTLWSEESPVIGTDTLWLLFNADGIVLDNPNADF